MYRRSIRRLANFLRATHGQDLAEYAMITALVGLVGIAAWALIEARFGQAYTNYDVGVHGLWEPPDPGTR